VTSHRPISTNASPRQRLGIALAALCLSALALAQQQSTERITPNFKEADITQIIEAVSMATGKNFIIDPRVRAQVTMLSSTPMTPDQFYQAFLAILQVHGFVAVPAGNVIKIVPDANMRQYPADDLPEHVSSTSDEMVTQVLAVKNVSAAQLVPVLRPLMPQNAQLSAVTGANILILSDHANNVNRMIRIIERIDQVGSADIDVIPLLSATAADTARVITSLIAQSGEGASNVKIVADERSNSVLVSGDPGQRLRVRTLVAHLDTPVETGSETQVRYLHYSDATDLATRLKEQLSGTSSGSSSTSTMNALLNRTVPQPQLGAAPTGQGAAAAAAGAAGNGGAAQLTLAGGQATIWADKDTNALIVTAGPRTMRALNAVIDKLDIRRPQVIVQAVIVSVSLDKTMDLGVNWALDGSATSVGVGGFISPIGGSSIVDLVSDAQSVTALTSNPPTGTTIGIGKLTASGLNFAAILRALQSDARTNILGTPSVVTRDNQEAKMEVAQEVPFLTGQYTTQNGTGSAFQTIQRQEVGTILTVTPQINEGDVILLKLQIESSSIAASSAGAVDLITNKNVITTSVLIRDGGTLVLGGLLQDSSSNTENTVPLLGHIPIIGELFRTRDTSKTKSDFLIFLQPRILRDDVQAARETDAKFNYMRNEQRITNKDGTYLPLAPYQPITLLPMLHNGQSDSGILSPDAARSTPLAPTPAPGPAPASAITPAPAPAPAAAPATATPAPAPSAIASPAGPPATGLTPAPGPGASP
jgi:general secretion pathway protein D